jgi:hypothetical protein
LGESYLHVYERYFAKFRNEPINLVEIGVRHGRSLAMWERFFPKAKIIGVDVLPGCLKYAEGRKTIIIGDQSDESTTELILKAADRRLSIVVDDGSHLNERTLKTFQLLWPFVVSGGYYVFEDMKTSYRYNIVEDMKRGGWLSPYITGKEHNDRKVINKWLIDNIKNIDHCKGSIRSIHIHSKTYIMERI